MATAIGHAEKHAVPHARALRTALSHYATGVTIITARGPGGHPIGMTANSFASVSLDPPLVLWSLAKSALSGPTFTAATYFAVNVLAADQEALARRFARQGSDKFTHVKFTEGHGGIPLLSGAAATLECRRWAVHEGGDHLILIGEVLAHAYSGAEPLVFHRGAYKRVAEP